MPAKAKDLNPAIRHDYCPVNTNAVFQDYQIISIINIIIILLPYKILNSPHYHSCSRLLFGSQCNLAIMSPKFRTTNFAFGMTTHFLCNFNEFIFQFIPAFNSINMPSKLSLKDFWTSVSLNYRIFKWLLTFLNSTAIISKRCRQSTSFTTITCTLLEYNKS